ncbi:MAG: hypothetical protein ACM3MI_04110 [Clostridiales bacterium]
MAKNVSVFGIYSSKNMIEEGIDSLRLAGFRHEDISVLLPENISNKDVGFEKGTKAPEGAATGAGTGAVIGGALGWLAGIGALAIPGVGPFIAAGPIVAALAGLGAGGAIGGITGTLIGMGIPEYEAKRYDGRIKSGGMLISIHCDNREWAQKAKEILVNTGADDISSTSEAEGDFNKSDKPNIKKDISPGNS